MLLGGGVPLVWGTLKQMTQGRLYVDTIAALAIVGSLLSGEYLAGALVVLMQAGGEALEDYGLKRANRSLENLLRRAPSIAHCKVGAEFVDVPAAKVAIGDTLLVRPGDIIAADGVVLEGQGNVDEAALTGEPVPLAKRVGDKVFSGTINLSGSLLVQTTSTAAQSKYELIVRMVQEAQGERAPINRLANRYTPLFTFFTLFMALGVWLLTHDGARTLAVLVVATPCPLIIATPLAVLSAMNSAAALNIIVKSGAAIEQAGAVQSIVFDKTGTLTCGQPSLSEIRSFKGEEQELLEGVAAVELHSTHILASAIVHAARDRQYTVLSAESLFESPGSGVTGLFRGHRFSIGSGSFLHTQGVSISEEHRSERAALGSEGKTVAYIGKDSDLAGMLIFEDRVRDESPNLIRRLKAMGISRLTMLTGDAPETAQAVAKQIGIEDVRFRLQPEDKLKAVEAMAREGGVMMVGDGINDAPALAKATVGVAMGGYGAGIATDAADIVITVENVERVADIVRIGRRMVTVARQGIFLGIGVSILLMALASTGYISPTLGALLQEVLDLTTILNALRAR